MYTLYMHTQVFVMGFFLLCALRTPWAIYSVAFAEKVWQCRNAAVCQEHCATVYKHVNQLVEAL